jgi:hypothetical protein
LTNSMDSAAGLLLGRFVEVMVVVDEISALKSAGILEVMC